METGAHKIGIDAVGDMAAWGTHISLFYETKEDLLDALVPYCRTGLESGESCLWVVAEPLSIEEALGALRKNVSSLDKQLADARIELAPARDWFLQNGTFDSDRVTAAWYEKLASVSARCSAGVRATGDTTWLDKNDWKAFCKYEEGLNEVVSSKRVAILCTYPLAKCGALEIMDVVRTHQFALVRRHGIWDVIETAGLKQAKAELKRLNEELEQRVMERTSQLLLASEKLREAQMELSHVNRVTAMGQLAASISHEVMQPISASVNNAQTALRCLRDKPQDIEEALQALGRVVKDGKRAGDILNRIRALMKRGSRRKSWLDVNEAIRDVISLARGEMAKNGVSVKTQLTAGLPPIEGDRVQLQQVVLNLILNAIQAMAGVPEGTRQLLVSTGTDASDGVFVAVQDSGPGLPSGSTDRLFDPFYTTKPSGMGMGLSICRSIVEEHGGRIWASPERGLGATVQFTLPVTAIAHDAAA